MKLRTAVILSVALTTVSGLPAVAEGAASATQDSQAVSLVGPGARWHWAYVLDEAAVHATPSDSAPVIAKLDTATSLGQPNLVQLLQAQRDADGRSWVLVRLAARPNGVTGWVPRSALDRFETVRTHLVVDRSSLVATLYRNGVEVFRARIGVGRPGTPTPAGEFYIREELRNVADPMYGPVAFGTSATAPTLTDWPGGGFIGIHGTNEPQLVPGRVSHGCIRMRNADVLLLARLMPLGTPVTIR